MAKHISVVTFQVKLPIIIKRDDAIDGYVAECPVLDVCSQGVNKKDTEKNIREAISLFLMSCFERGTLNDVLKDCGFHPLKKAPRKTAKPRPIPHEKTITVGFPMEVAC